MATVLLIEDNALLRGLVVEILALAGYAVRTAENGKLGVEAALASPPDLVICDIVMPVLDGYGVLQAFHRNPQLANIPFIFLTSRTGDAERRRGMDLGADDFLTKPFDSGELLGAVAGRLGRFQHGAAAGASPADAPLAGKRPPGPLTGADPALKPHAMARKHRIYAEGDEAVRLYFVQAGRVKTSRSTAAGKEFITGLYQTGEFFGYQALLAGVEHRESAVAVEATTLLYTPADDFRRLMRLDPEVTQQFVRLLARQVDQQSELLLDLAYESLRQRVAAALLRLHEQQGPADLPPWLVLLTREDLAAVVGTAPESLSRILSDFRQEGLIQLTSKSIELLQPERLRPAAPVQRLSSTPAATARRAAAR